MSMTIRPQVSPQLRTLPAKAAAPAHLAKAETPAQPAVKTPVVKAIPKGENKDLSTPFKIGGAILGAAGGAYGGYFGGTLSALVLTMAGLSVPFLPVVGLGIALGAGLGGLAGGGLGKLASKLFD